MRGRLMAAAAAGIAMGAGLIVMPPSFAATACDDATTPVPGGSTVTGNLVVPAGTTCDLNSVTVTGNVTVQPNAILRFLAAGNRVGGNITSNSANEVRLHDVSVGGGVTLTGTNGQLSFVCNSHISGGLSVTQSTVSFFIGGGVPCGPSGGNAVGGSLNFNNNATGEIDNNKIGNSLNCSGNSPPPTGSGNTANGGLNGQCATFS